MLQAIGAVIDVAHRAGRKVDICDPAPSNGPDAIVCGWKWWRRRKTRGPAHLSPGVLTVRYRAYAQLARPEVQIPTEARTPRRV